MTARVAINGFGRIGRLTLRAMLERHKQELTVVAINDMADLQTNAHLFRYDSTYGIFPGQVEVGEGVLRIDGRNIAVLNQKDPSRLPWRQLNVDIAVTFLRATSLPRHPVADEAHRAARLLARGIETHLPQQHQGVHGGVPPAVPRRAAPPPVGPLEGEQPRARALGGDPRALGGDLVRGRTDQVSHRLPADRRVRIKQPLDDRSVWLRGLPFG